MKQNDGDKILGSLVLGGLIGASLGALFFKNKGKGAVVGTVAGAAVLATYKANEKAKETNLPVYVMEEGAIYAVSSKGKRKFIKHIEKQTKKTPKRFKLK